MNFELDHDLTAWADGTLSREDLITLHGQQGLALVNLHERLLGAAETPVPDPDAGWALLQRKMDGKVVPIRAGARPRLRRAVLTLAAALLIGGGALAAVRGVAFDHPGVVGPPAGNPTSQGGTHEGSPDQTGRPAGATGDRLSGHQSSSTSAPTGGTDDPVAGSGTSTSGSGGGTQSDGTSTGDSGDGGTTQDPDGQHSGKGNAGEDHGNDGPHGHGRASSTHA